MEIESRLLPCGLHTVGVPPTAEEAVATLVNIAQRDRPEDGFKGLPRLMAESMNRDIDEIYRNNNQGVLEDVELLNNINQACRAAVLASVSVDRRRRAHSEVNDFFAGAMSMLTGGSPWYRALKEKGFTVSDDTLKPLFTYLQFCLKQVVADNELGASERSRRQLHCARPRR